MAKKVRVMYQEPMVVRFSNWPEDDLASLDLARVDRFVLGCTRSGTARQYEVIAAHFAYPAWFLRIAVYPTAQPAMTALEELTVLLDSMPKDGDAAEGVDVYALDAEGHLTRVSTT